jgi:hypothetical protein
LQHPGRVEEVGQPEQQPGLWLIGGVKIQLLQ